MKVSEAVYADAVKRLKAKASNHRKGIWELADELLRCEKLLGDRFSQAVEVTQLAPDTISNYLGVARAWPADIRQPDMPFDMHAALVTLDDKNKASVMRIASKALWTRADVRQRMKAWKDGDVEAFDPAHRIALPTLVLPGKPAGGETAPAAISEAPASDNVVAFKVPTAAEQWIARLLDAIEGAAANVPTIVELKAASFDRDRLIKAETWLGEFIDAITGDDRHAVARVPHEGAINQ